MNNVFKDIDAYYTGKIRKYGAIPKGVDWNDEESQFIRFEQLSKVIKDSNFSINDIGCGYGVYSKHLDSLGFDNFNYTGYDLSREMIHNANKMHGKSNISNPTFSKIKSLKEVTKSDYSVASGIFNVKMKFSNAEWLSYILDTLENINEKSKKGFSFNMLTKYSDKELMRGDLYYADPLFFFDYCKRNYSKEVSLLHDYDLYEFTILVKKV